MCEIMELKEKIRNDLRCSNEKLKNTANEMEMSASCNRLMNERVCSSLLCPSYL